MQLDDVTAGFLEDEEAGKRFAKTACQNLRGRVRRSFGDVSKAVLITAVLLGVWYLVFRHAPTVLLMLTAVPAWLGAFVALWNMVRWELTFDGETGWFGFSSLFGTDLRFHVSEIYRIRRESVRSISRGLKKWDMLSIEVGNTVIPVVLRKYWFETKHTQRQFKGGYTDAEKLSQYLELYQRYLAPPDFGMQRSPQGELAPAVAAAIAAQRAEMQENAPAPAEKPVSEQKPAPEKPQVDVDALFNSIVQEHRKKK